MNKGRPPRTIEQRLHSTSVATDTVTFEKIGEEQGIRLVTGKSGLAWLSTVDLDPESTPGRCHLMALTTADLRTLADALKPYQTPEKKPYTTDRFCHTCGAVTIENKPRNDAPTFHAPREGHDPQQAAGIR